jgi:hypothetical protein
MLPLVLLMAHALVPIDSSMRSFGVAIKAGTCKTGVEQLMFENNVTMVGGHGVITQQWHAGTRGDPRMRVYVDEEADAQAAGQLEVPDVDYLGEHALPATTQTHTHPTFSHAMDWLSRTV